MNRAMRYQSGGSIKISANIEPLASDDYLAFLAQIGVKYCYTWLDDDQLTAEFLTTLKGRLKKFGLTLYNAANLTLGKSAAIHLGLPERDEHIRRYIEFLGVLSEAGVHTTTITWEPNGTLSTSPVTGKATYLPEAVTRGGAAARMIDLNVLSQMPLSHGRMYSKDEIWSNFEYFVKKVIPAAEKYEVRISLHPNDPPTDSVAGIATLIQSADDYRRAFDIASSDFFGMELCCGCWLEGGANNFGDVHECIREFVGREKVFIVHFRNVTGMLPCFVETFLDDGYGDMRAIMKTFLETGYTGAITLDHTPRMVACAGDTAATAFAVGYLKGLINALSR